jgi:hypothetical protein
VQYLDVGVFIDAHLDGTGSTLRVLTKVEQSAMGDEKSGLGAQDPVVRQTMLENTVTLAPGKPVVLGSLEIPGSTRHAEISLEAEPMP